MTVSSTSPVARSRSKNSPGAPVSGCLQGSETAVDGQGKAVKGHGKAVAGQCKDGERRCLKDSQDS